MRPRRLAIASTAMTAGGVVLDWAADRGARRGQDAVDDPEWQELRQPVRGRAARRVLRRHGAARRGRRDLRDEFRLVLYDQRGHGRSQQAAAGDYSIEALGADLAAVVAAAVPHGPRAVLVGHSLGGMAILSYVRQLPQVVAERVVGAVFIDTTGSDVLTGAVVSTGVAAVSAPRNRLTRAAFGRRASASLSFLLTRAIGLSAQARPAHVALTEQLLVQCRLTPLAQARRLADALPDAQLLQLPGVGHMAPLEAHEAISGHLRAFARRLIAVADADAVAEAC